MSTVSENLEAIFSVNDSAFGRGIDRMVSGLNRLGRQTEQVSQGQVRSFDRARDSLGRFVSTGRSAGNDLGKFFLNPLDSLSKLTTGFFTASKALQILKSGLVIVSDFERLDAGIRATSTSNIDFAQSQAYLHELSDTLGVSYEALAQSYKGLKAATNGTNLEGEQTQKIFTAVVHAGAALKLSNEDVKGTLLALSQMVSKGTVSMEELRQQLGERLPAAFSLSAKAMGVSTEELAKMIANGEVMASDLLPKLANELEKTYGAQAQSNINTMAGGWTRATDQLKLYIAEFAKTNGIDTFFAKITNGIADVTKKLREEQKGSLQTEYENFLALPADQRKARMSQLGGDINRAQAELNTRLYNLPETRNMKREAELEKQLKVMRQLYGAMYMAVKEDAKKAAATQVLAVNDPIKALEKAKDRFKFLTDLKAGLSLQGKSLSKSQAAELAKLTSQLEEAGVKKAPKGKAPYISDVSAIDYDTKLLGDLRDRAKDYARQNPISFQKDGLPQELAKSIDLLEKAQKETDELFKRFDHPKAAGVLIKQIDPYTGINPVKSNNSSLKLPSLDKLEVMRKGLQYDNGTATIGKLVKSIGDWKAPLKSQTDAIQEIFNNLVDGVKQTFTSAAPAAAQAVGDFIGAMIEGTATMDDLPKAILGVVAETLRSLATALAAAGAGLMLIGAAGQGGRLLAGSVGLFAASAVAQNFAQPKRRKMAKGGTLHSATQLEGGEYSGARARPEWVSPVDVGAKLIAKNLSQMGGMNGGGRVVFEIYGSRLRGVLENEGYSQETYYAR